TTEKISLNEFAQYSKMLNKSARNIYILLNNLLEWAQIQKGTIQFTPTNFDLSKLVSLSIDTISQRALQKQIEIINEISNSQKVYADEKIINTVLRNLLSNAVKFTRTDGKVIVKSKRFDDGTIKVSIEDNGVGISEDIIKKLFRIDQKVGSLGTEGEPSTGLGLLLCKEFVEMHKQKIWVESKKEKGSTFSFTLKEENGHETK
ncbi:MAG: HAMP domain-containing histidine kinase, partial [Bacteroidales bacterium]|nr:HAMP domain-containing histidine kinase [Bacteroidales bacterium]